MSHEQAFRPCRFEIRLDERAPGGAWCQCAAHGGSGPAHCKAVAAELERWFSLGAALTTAGAPGEAALWEHQVGTVLIRQMPDDPAALRVSLGQPHQPGDQPGSPGRGAAYLVFRGDPAAVSRLLERALAAMRAAF